MHCILADRACDIQRGNDQYNPVHQTKWENQTGENSFKHFSLWIPSFKYNLVAEQFSIIVLTFAGPDQSNFGKADQ